jgi:hypothetical protein
VSRERTEVISGTPVQIGSEIFARFCAPAIHAATTSCAATPKQLAQLYSGFIMAVLGSMAADFGQEQAEQIARALVDSFAGADLDAGARLQ